MLNEPITSKQKLENMQRITYIGYELTSIKLLILTEKAAHCQNRNSCLGMTYWERWSTGNSEKVKVWLYKLTKWTKQNLSD